MGAWGSFWAMTSWLVIGSALAWAEPGVLLAPAPEELVQAERELEQRVLEAEAIGRAASRLQNAAFHEEDPCAGGLRVRARAFGEAWRDAAQRARVQAERTALIASAQTLGPLVDADRQAQIETFGGRAERTAVSWLEFDRLESRTRAACTDAIQPGPGLPDPTPRAVGEEDVPVAVWVLSGRLCPGAREVRGVTVVRGPVCVDLDPACSCDPVPAQSGAVLAP